jgi:CheY-like chemotaxis protein
MGVKKVTLLHIEDDNVDKMVVGRVLSKMDVVNLVHHASNGEEALNKLKGENGEELLSPFPNIILLDINMPKMNGIEFLKELRSDENLKHLSVYMVTTSNDDEDVKGAYEFNVAGYIIKPVDIAHFVKTFKLVTDFWKLCEFPK